MGEGMWRWEEIMSPRSAHGKTKEKTRRRDDIQVASLPVSVDYPRSGEVVTSRAYTIRISAESGIRGVEVSINGAKWRPCRESLGLWWYDWAGYMPGEYEIHARIRKEDGTTVLSPKARFAVSLS